MPKQPEQLGVHAQVAAHDEQIKGLARSIDTIAESVERLGRKFDEFGERVAQGYRTPWAVVFAGAAFISTLILSIFAIIRNGDMERFDVSRVGDMTAIEARRKGDLSRVERHDWEIGEIRDWQLKEAYDKGRNEQLLASAIQEDKLLDERLQREMRDLNETQDVNLLRYREDFLELRQRIVPEIAGLSERLRLLEKQNGVTH